MMVIANEKLNGEYKFMGSRFSILDLDNYRNVNDIAFTTNESNLGDFSIDEDIQNLADIGKLETTIFLYLGCHDNFDNALSYAEGVIGGAAFCYFDGESSTYVLCGHADEESYLDETHLRHVPDDIIVDIVKEYKLDKEKIEEKVKANRQPEQSLTFPIDPDDNYLVLSIKEAVNNANFVTSQYLVDFFTAKGHPNPANKAQNIKSSLKRKAITWETFLEWCSILEVTPNITLEENK